MPRRHPLLLFEKYFNAVKNAHEMTLREQQIYNEYIMYDTFVKKRGGQAGETRGAEERYLGCSRGNCWDDESFSTVFCVFSKLSLMGSYFFDKWEYSLFEMGCILRAGSYGEIEQPERHNAECIHGLPSPVSLRVLLPPFRRHGPVMGPNPAPARPVSLSNPHSCMACRGKEKSLSPTLPQQDLAGPLQGDTGGGYGSRQLVLCAPGRNRGLLCLSLAARPWPSSLHPEEASGPAGTRQINTDPTAVSQGKRPLGSPLGEISHQHPRLFGCEL